MSELISKEEALYILNVSIFNLKSIKVNGEKIYTKDGVRKELIDELLNRRKIKPAKWIKNVPESSS